MSELADTPNPQHSSDAVNQLFMELPDWIARGLVYVVLLLMTSAVVYATVGKMSEVVTASATVVSSGAVRPVQASTSGRVTRVAVREGETVERDQALVYLETGAAEAQLTRAHEERRTRERQLQELLATQADSQQVAEARARASQARAEETAAERAAEAGILTAPVAGLVTRLSVRGSGEAVQPGQVVAEIAPAGSPLVLEARIANRDVGRMRPGLPVKVKIDAYPHQEYGTLQGTVRGLSPDAVSEPNTAPTYRAVIEPTSPGLSTVGKKIDLRLGMTGAAEVVVGDKRIIELVLKAGD